MIFEITNETNERGWKLMNEEVNQGLDALLPALRTLQRALEQIQASGATKGSGHTALRHYRLLHEQIARLLPEDRHIVEGLAAEVDETAGDEAMVAQALLLTQQLYVYVRGITRQAAESNAGHRGNEYQRGPSAKPWKHIADDYRRLGREMRDQIMQQTRDSIRSAMSGIQVDIQHAWEDWDAAHPVPPTPPTPPASPFPPHPPVAPTPPKGKRRIHIELDDDDNIWTGQFEDAPDPSDKPPTTI
jgi:hypothetical protein